MARTLEIALEVERPVAEGADGLALGRGARFLELHGRADDAHAAAASSRSRLHEEWKPDLVGCSVREDGHARLTGDPLRDELVRARAQRAREGGRST